MKVLTLVLALLTPSLAAAQIAGVPVDALTPDGMHRVDVNLPFHAGVQLFYAPEGQARATLRVDVEVGSDAADAADAAAWFVRTSAGALPRLDGVGDHARGASDLVAFVRDNVFVVVRPLTQGPDGVSIAHRLDDVIQRAPRGSTASAPVALPALTTGSNALQLPGWVLASNVEARGAASARRTRGGWVVSLGESAPYGLTVQTCDAMLRRRVTTLER